MFVFLLLLLFSSLNTVASYASLLSSKTLVFNKSGDVLPAYYQDVTTVNNENQLIFTPSMKGKMLRLIRPSNDPIILDLKIQKNCESKIYFYFPQSDFESKFCKFELDIKPSSIRLQDTHLIVIDNAIKEITVNITTNEFKIDVYLMDDEAAPVSRTYIGCKLDIEKSFGEENNVIAEFFLYGTNNDCKHQLIFNEATQLALQFINTTKPIPTTIPTTAETTQPTVTSTKKKVTTTEKSKEEETGNAEFAVHWYIIILIAEIIVCFLIGAFSTWLYVKLTKRFKTQPRSSISAEEEEEYSPDEEIETALEDLQTAQSGAGNNEDGAKNRSQSVSTAPIFRGGNSVQTARHPLNTQRNAIPTSNLQPTQGSKTGQKQSQKTKKSFLERMGNKFKRKNKESNSKKLYFQQPQISVSGFSTSTTMNLPFGESKEVVKARRGGGEKAAVIAAVAAPAKSEKKKDSLKKIKAYSPFSKEFGGGGMDQQGCEPTQASMEEAYQADLAVLSQARRNAELHARLYRPDGRVRTAKELAEYDAQKAAAPATRSSSKKR